MTFQPVLPWWLLLPLIAAAMAFLGWQLYGGRRKGRQWHVGSSRRAGLRHATLVLLLAGAALRPGLPGGTAPAASADLNVFFVVDTTTSMVAEDHGNGRPRMEGVRHDIMAIAAELPGARFSVLTFDTKGHVRMPLTTDTLALETITSVLEPQVTAYAKGSSISAARQVLAERLTAARDSHPERPRLVFYLGDGEQTSSAAPEPLGMGNGLVSGGAVLGYGTPAGGRMKENTGMASDGGDRESRYVQDAVGRDAVSVIDEGRLREIASQLQVPYVHRAAGDPAAPMLQQARPGTTESGENDASLPGKRELYWVFAAGAFALALVEFGVVLRRVRALQPTKAREPEAAAEGRMDPRSGKARGDAR
jgi:Ca-activated chloride channel homolog